MKKFLIKLCVNTASLMIVAWLIPGISIRLWPAAVSAALVLIFLNMSLRPLLLFFTWPLTFLTLGLFTVFINGLIFFIASRVVAGFDVRSVWTACLGALVMSAVNFILEISFTSGGNFRFQTYSAGNAGNAESKYGEVIDAEIKESEKPNREITN